ncbi:MAG: translation initiation factor IF-6 [Methanosarcinales archaeon]|nr:translation initiation factor IF-6 [Methanosarcinales archaeon]
MRDRRLKIAGSSLLGVFSRCTERVVLVPPETDPRAFPILEEGLGVKPQVFRAAGSSVVGSLVSGNSNGFMVTAYATEEEIKTLSEHGKVARLPGKISAAGNVILANDNAALVHPGLGTRACNKIAETLNVEVRRGTIGGLKTVGMTSVATNKGIIAHPRISEEELAILEELFQAPVDVGTVNFGSPLVGSGVLANSRGYLAGAETTGPELGRIEDTLGFVGW